MAYHRQQGVDTAIVRIFNTYGPRMRVKDGRAVPAFISQALRHEDVTVFGDGTQTRSFCYVSDLVDGIVRLMDSNTNEPVNIGNPHEVTIEEIDFVHDGVPHSLRFHWLSMEGRGRGTDMRYVYSPLRGLVDVQGNE